MIIQAMSALPSSIQKIKDQVNVQRRLAITKAIQRVNT